ncbi:MAG: DUF6338 family protein [Actinomycetota bacterium]
MMPDTFQSLVVVALALLPGALYIWGFERIVGNWGISLSDRLVRFVGVSAMLQVLWAPAMVFLWRDLVISGKAGRGVIPLWTWPFAIAYVALPFLLGSMVGRGTRRRARWSRVFTGPAPAPRAWDHLFASQPDGWIRLRLRDGTWLGGAYSQPEGDELGSYAAGYPDAQDLYLGRLAEVDPYSGVFLFDESGQIRMRSSGILIRWDEVQYLEFVDA